MTFDPPPSETDHASDKEPVLEPDHEPQPEPEPGPETRAEPEH